MSDETKKPFLTGLLTKMWEVFIEKLLVPVAMGALALGFATCQQKADQKLADSIYQQVAEKLNQELPGQLEALRKQVNTQGEAVEQLRVAVLELNLRRKIEAELRGPSGVRPTIKPPASQPSEEPFRLLKAKSAPRPMAPFEQRQLPAKMAR